MNVLFNPVYRLKRDGDRVYVFHRGGISSPEDRHDEGFCGTIHPLHAYILAFLNGEDLGEIADRIEGEAAIPGSHTESFVKSLMDHPHQKMIKYGDKTIIFPSRLIVSSDNKRDISYNPSDFLIEHPDFSVERPSSVSKLTFMVNNKCMTNCYYCYADKRNPIDCQIPIERFEELVEEAVRIGVASIDVIGGEFFLYNDWKRLLELLRQNHYMPLISTKAWLEEEDVDFLARVGMSQIQISIDSMIPETLKTMGIGNRNYLEKIQETFRLLEKYGIKVAVHSILTLKNSTEEDFQSIYEFLCTLHNVLYWKPDLASESIYSPQHVKGSVAPDNESIRKIRSLTKSIGERSPFPVLYQGLNEQENYKVMPDWTEFNNRSMCSGNYFSLFILPDGKVTICEELYWHPRFIIGDVTKQSLQQVWSSPEALDLYNLSQQSLNSKKSLPDVQRFCDLQVPATNMFQGCDSPTRCSVLGFSGY